MSQVDQILNLIDNVLQSENKESRDAAQQTLVSLRTSNPNELLLAFLFILSGQYKTPQRNFSASQLRLNLSEFSPSTYTNLWDKLSEETKSQVKKQLFIVLFAEQDQSMKKHIADTLGQIAGSILSKDINAWPEFKTNVWQLFSQSTGSGILPGFFILDTFLPFCPNLFSDNAIELFTLFQNGLKHENNKVKLSALSAFSSYLQILEHNQHKNFKTLTTDIYNAVYILLNQDGQQQGLELLTEMLDIDHKFFKASFKQLIQLLQTVFNMKNIESGVKRMATETLVDYSEKSPATFRKNKQYLTAMLQMIFSHMIEIDNDISNEWKQPQQGYNDDMEDDEDFETTRFGMGAIDRIIYSIGDKQVLPILSEAIKQLLKNQDWRYQYTAIMALSQVGEYIEDATNISSIIEMILNYFGNVNPMLRYAACHAIGQISDDMKPKFQELYGKQTYPRLILLLKDPIPRVVSHSAAALTNFLEGMKYESCQPQLNQMMEQLVILSRDGISLVKQSCLGAISSVAEVCKQHFNKYIEIVVQLLFNIIDTHTSKQYKQLRGQAIQTMTIIASSVGANAFRPAIEKLINIMIHIQQSKFEQTDPQKTYILAGWQRLCIIYGQQLAGYLNRILPSLFELVKNVINNELTLVNNPDTTTEDKQQKDQSEGINTFETQEAQVAISMLNVFIEQLKELYSPYVEQTVTLLCKIIKQHLNDSVRQQACKCLPSLVSAIKVTNKEGAVAMTKYFMATLVQTIEKQSDPSIICFELETLKQVIEDLGISFLTSQQIEEFTKKMLLMLNQAEEAKEATHKYMKQGQQLDDEDKQLFDEEIKQQQEVQVSISQVFGILFKTHLDMTIPIAEYLITTVLPNVLKAGLSDNTYKFAIFMIDDLVEFLGYSRLSHHWDGFGKVLLSFCDSKSCQLRQAACYGLGVYAQSTPTNVSSNIIEIWLQKLIESSKIAKGGEKQKTYGHCRDNAISSIGKIIKSHGQSFNCGPYISYWLTFLPLRFDKPEAILQHELLIDIMLNKPELVLGTQATSQLGNLTKVLSVYGQVLNNHKIYNSAVKEKMKAHVLGLASQALFASNQDKIWQNLAQKEKEALKNLVN